MIARCESRRMWLPLKHKVTNPSFMQRCKGERTRLELPLILLCFVILKTNMIAQSQRQLVTKMDFYLMYMYQLFKKGQKE